VAATRLERLAWDEAEVALRSLPVLLPLGARLKEHGLHLPLNNDWLLANALAERVAEQIDLVLLPTLEHGYYPAFVDYPGSVHLSPQTALALLQDLGRSVLRWGARKLYVLNTGISTLWTLEPARLALAADGLQLEYSRPHALGRAAREAVREQPHGTHADEIETSMMLYLAPEVVRMERASTCTGPAGPGPLRRTPGPGGLYSPSGVYGDATLARRDKGERLVEAVVADLVEEVRTFFREDHVPRPPDSAYLQARSGP
jgi:creatinine amidohydrolase